jgi:hypothetical protein
MLPDVPPTHFGADTRPLWMPLLAVPSSAHATARSPHGWGRGAALCIATCPSPCWRHGSLHASVATRIPPRRTSASSHGRRSASSLRGRTRQARFRGGEAPRCGNRDPDRAAQRTAGVTVAPALGATGGLELGERSCCCDHRPPLSAMYNATVSCGRRLQVVDERLVRASGRGRGPVTST